MGETPDWVAGYVPPAGEWNAWWAKKIDETNPAFAGSPFLSLAGGTMLAPLYLPLPAPVAPAEAVNKAYVDSLTFAAGPFMAQSGGTFSGPVITTSTITLVGNPVNPLEAAPKQYVDAAANSANNAQVTANAAVRRAGDTMTGLLVLASDPVSAGHAVTKSYADTKFPFVGGTINGPVAITGSLEVFGPLYSHGAFYANAFNSWEWAFSVDASTGNKYQSYRTGWYDQWAGSTGARTWVGGNVSLMNLDGGGNLNVKAQLSANTVVAAGITSSGNLSVAGTAYAGALAMGPWVLYNNGNQIQQHTTGWYDEWVTATGQRNWVGGNVVQMQLSPGGDLYTRGSHNAVNISASAAVLAGTGLFADHQNIYIGAGGQGRLIVMQSNWYWEFTTANGDMTWIADYSPAQAFFAMRPGPGDCICYRGGFTGNGGYYNYSDERVKSDIVPAACGLAEVLNIEPIEFTRAGHDSVRELGFSAQQIRRVIPLAVRPIGITLSDGTGGLDSDDPTLGVVLDPVVVALVNGMKELAAEVAALKARS